MFALVLALMAQLLSFPADPTVARREGGIIPASPGVGTRDVPSDGPIPLAPGANEWSYAYPWPTPRASPAMAYDSRSDRIVLFGGSGLSDTWGYDLDNNTWREMTPATGPAPRGDAAMAYDSRSDRIVLFGGSGLSDTWGYDLDNNTWREMTPATGPAARDDALMAYDSQSDQVVLITVGCDPYPSCRTETWSYAYGANTWTNLTAFPAPRATPGGAMAYDAESDRVIAATVACDPGFNCWSETWAYNLDANAWTNMTTADGPSIRSSAAATYDNKSDRVILFGGSKYIPPAPGEPRGLSDTWAYDFYTNTWSNVTVGGPAAREAHAIAYDARSDRTVLFGGYRVHGDGPERFYDDTWTFQFPAGLWNLMSAAQRPAPRFGHSMAYASSAGGIILFGGETEWFDPILGPQRVAWNDTWSYDLETNDWTDLGPAPAPPRRLAHAMAYDSRSDHVVLFGGSRYEPPSQTPTNDTWLYNVTAIAWTNVTPSQSPPARDLHSMAYDSQSDQIVLFGGRNFTTTFSDTWTYNLTSNTWTNKTPAVGPSARVGAAMTYDVRSGLVVLFGGNGLSDTWVYNYTANTWTNMTPVAAPSGGRIAYDEWSDRVILLGGGETWAYDANANLWTNLSPAKSPSADGPMVYDAKSGHVVLLGSLWLGGDEVWWYRYAPSLPTPPRSLQAGPGNTEVSLSWQVPALDGGSTITGYRVYRGSSPGGESLLATLGDVSLYTDSGLTNGVTYYYRVRALSAVGEGLASNEADGTPTAAPSAPETLRASPGDALVNLTWQPPALDGGSPVTNYRVYRGTTSGGEGFLLEVGNVTAHADPGLTNGVTYYYVVRAVNAGGEGPSSSEASATPSALTAPLNLQATAGDGAVNLVWGPPGSDGGFPVTNYRIYRGLSAGGESFLSEIGNVTAYGDVGVTNGVTYFYEVSAVNAVAEGPRSTEVSANPAGTPGPPTALSALAGDGSVTLSWLPPANDGGRPITSYSIYRGLAPGGETLLATLGTVTAYTDPGLSNGVAYYYQVTAGNAIGASPRSSEVSITPTGAPSPPQNLQAAAGDRQVRLSWSPPASDGGSPVTAYRIYRGTAPGGEVWLVEVGNVTAYDDAGLPNGVPEYYQVAALNAVGEGPRSSESTATPAAPPSAPLTVRATGGDGSVALSWDPPASDGGLPITGYRIYRGTSLGSETLHTTVGAVLNYTDRTVTNGVTYYYVVAAVNAAGEGPPSAAMSGTPGPPRPDGLPGILLAATAATAGATGGTLLILLYARIRKEEVFQRKLRQLIYDYLSANPGASFTEVRDALGLRNGVAAYHLAVLHRLELIHSEGRRGRRWFYPNGDVSLWRELPVTPLQDALLEAVKESPGIGVRALAREVAHSTSSVAYNVRSLSRDGLLRTERAGVQVRCFPEDDRDR